MSAFFETLNILFASFFVQNSGYVLKFFFVMLARFLHGSTAITFFLSKFLINTPSLLPISITILGLNFFSNLFAIFLNASLIVMDSEAL